jgi:hypothetical protein
MSTNARNIEQIKGNADIGRFRFKAGNDWVGGTYNRAIVKEFYGALQERSRHERRGDASKRIPTVLNRCIRSANVRAVDSVRRCFWKSGSEPSGDADIKVTIHSLPRCR